MRQFLHVPKFQELGQALDGVKASKDRVQGFRIWPRPLQSEYLAFDVDQMFAAF